jgi:hypothetical protein
MIPGCWHGSSASRSGTCSACSKRSCIARRSDGYARNGCVVRVRCCARQTPSRKSRMSSASPARRSSLAITSPGLGSSRGASDAIGREPRSRQQSAVPVVEARLPFSVSWTLRASTASGSRPPVARSAWQRCDEMLVSRMGRRLGACRPHLGLLLAAAACHSGQRLDWGDFELSGAARDTQDVGSRCWWECPRCAF